jgi:3-oxoacyl-[acyl-carrier-protein] synthase II
MVRVAITGLGWITALGQDVPSVWGRLVAGEHGIGPITYFDASQYACHVAAEVRQVCLEGTGLQAVPMDCTRRGTQLFLKSALEASADAGLAGSGVPLRRVGVAAGFSVNYIQMKLMHHYYRFKRQQLPCLDLERFAREGRQPANSFYRRQGELSAVVVAKALGLGGPVLVTDVACAASSYAIGEAFRYIRRGAADAMIAGGASSLVSPVGILAFSTLGALSTTPDPGEASRPFDRRRNGFVMGEGGGAVVLERLDLAVARGARVYGELVGYGSTMNAQNLTDPSPDGVCEETAMRLALAEAKLAPESIDYVAAHGTSTLKNDLTETVAIKRVFGPHARRLMVSSNKGQIGHTIAGAGVANVICAVKAMREGWVAPTAHYRDPDPACDLDYVPNVGRRASVGAALANAFAFGGQNAVLALRAV